MKPAVSCPTNHRHVTIGVVLRVVDGPHGQGPQARVLDEVGLCRDCGYAVERRTPLRAPGAWRLVAGPPVAVERAPP